MMMQEASRRHVADAGNEADDAVQAEADRRTGNPEEVVQQMREQVEVLVVERLAAALCERGVTGSRVLR